jgi:hypothetical protein
LSRTFMQSKGRPQSAQSGAGGTTHRIGMRYKFLCVVPR